MTDCTGYRVGDAIRSAAGALTAAGVPDAHRDARVLAAASTGLTREQILRDPQTLIDDRSLGRFRAATARRARREPVSRIVGFREFMGIEFLLDRSTLDPRPDSEVLVEIAMPKARLRPGPISVLDVGTGTGCLLLSILAGAPGASGVGTDVSERACRTAASNAARLKLHGRASFVVCDWAEALSGRFDMVVSNPPYIPTGEIEDLAPEVRDFDPRAALDGGSDGLDCYRLLADSVVPRLAAGGVLVVEIGPWQSGDVTKILSSAGLKQESSKPDLAGRTRALVFTRGG